MSELDNLIGAVRTLQAAGHRCDGKYCLVCTVVRAKTAFVLANKRHPLVNVDSATGARAHGTTLQQDGRGRTWRTS